jgi:hypothetical protein
VLGLGLAALCGAAVENKPADQAETLKRIGQAAAYVEKALDDVTQLLPPEKVPDIHPKSISLALAVAFLRAHTDQLGADKATLDSEFDAIAGATLKLSKASDNGDAVAAAANLDDVKKHWSAVKSQVPAGLFAAKLDPPVYGCIMHANQTSPTPGICPICGMVLVPKQAFQVAISEQKNTVTADVQVSTPLQAGVEANVLLHLKADNGKPVPVSDLLVVHTQPIHLLVIDQSLGDYHHIHPKPTANPGEYAFTFTPRKPGPYAVYADIVPLATGRQEYARTDIPGAADPEKLTNKDTVLKAEVEDLTYTLKFNQEHLVRGDALVGKLHISRTADHEPFTRLEPLMGVFAHFVGFHEDHESLIHIHPLGPDPVPVGSHGGPDLDFQFIPQKSGFVRFFAQVQIGGADKFVPFQLNFEEPKETAAAAPK